MSDLKRAHSKRTTEQQDLTRDSLRAALVLQQLRAHHLANWAELEADDAVWDDWLMTIGRAALELQDTYGKRSECEHGTALDGCDCYGCTARGQLLRVEGSGRGSQGLTARWLPSECMRRGMELHAAWVHGIKKRAPVIEESKRPAIGALVGRGRK